MRTSSLAFAAALLLSSAACSKSSPATATEEPAAEPVATDDAPVDGEAVPVAEAEALLAAEMSAYEAAKPVFEEYCSACHTPKDKETEAVEHFAMAGYPFGGHEASEIGHEIREVLGVEGEEATMPLDDPGAVQGDELELVVAWSQAWDAAHAARAGYHAELGGDDHGDEH